MNKKNFYLFPVFVKQIKNFITEEQTVKIVDKLKKIKIENHNALTKNKGFSSHNIIYNILNELDKSIYSDLNKEVKEYANEYGFENLTISNSWFNIEQKNCILKNHTHAMSAVSGVLYLKTDKLSNKIYFYNPNPFIGFSHFCKNNILNFEYVYFDVDVGSILLFPSWLKHGSNDEKNKSFERISLSFNTTADFENKI